MKYRYRQHSYTFTERFTAQMLADAMVKWVVLHLVRSKKLTVYLNALLEVLVLSRSVQLPRNLSGDKRMYEFLSKSLEDGVFHDSKITNASETVKKLLLLKN